MTLNKTANSGKKGGPKSLRKPTMIKPPIQPPDPVVTTKFTVEPWETNDGEKVIVYGDTGIGKSSLCLLAPTPVFVGLDEGASKLRHPVTGLPPKRIPGIHTFADVRAALQQVDLYDDYETIVIDTATILEDWGIVHVVKTVPGKKGQPVSNIEEYGWKEGYRHLYDLMRGPLADCDELIRRGKNIIMIAQSTSHKVQHPGAEDFLRAGPRLYGGRPSVEALYCEWADHILRVDYHNTFIKDRKISGATTRAIYVQPEVWFRAKSRTVHEDVVAYDSPADNSIWGFIFGMDVIDGEEQTE